MDGVEVADDSRVIDLTSHDHVGEVDWKARCEAAEARAALAEQQVDSYRKALRGVHGYVLSVEDVLDSRGHR